MTCFTLPGLSQMEFFFSLLLLQTKLSGSQKSLSPEIEMSLSSLGLDLPDGPISPRLATHHTPPAATYHKQHQQHQKQDVRHHTPPSATYHKQHQQTPKTRCKTPTTPTTSATSTNINNITNHISSSYNQVFLRCNPWGHHRCHPPFREAICPLPGPTPLLPCWTSWQPEQ